MPKRFQYGFRLNVRGVYDDNIALTNTNPIADFYFAIEPGITLGFGDIVGPDPNFIRFDYAPSIILYADHSDRERFPKHHDAARAIPVRAPLAPSESGRRAPRRGKSRLARIRIQPGTCR